MDPFMGSGTTALVAMKEKRNFVGYEINKDYIELANKRIDAVKQELTSLF
ncbi:MAG: site-specific DNA-methyltransferase [Treponema sp.]|nr:site-specific DNA-methyltransferase [Treponema sp.]